MTSHRMSNSEVKKNEVHRPFYENDTTQFISASSKQLRHPQVLTWFDISHFFSKLVGFFSKLSFQFNLPKTNSLPLKMYSWTTFAFPFGNTYYFQVLLLMEEILHQLVSNWSNYLLGLIHSRWLFWISEPSTVPIESMGLVYLPTWRP